MNTEPIMPFPSDLKYPLIEVFYLEGESPFVCGVNGGIGDDMIEEIEKDLAESFEFMDKGAGTYLYRAAWQLPQVGDEGRIELPGYWDLELVRFQSVEQLSAERDVWGQEDDPL